MDLATKIATMRAVRAGADGETYALVTRTGNANITITWDELADAADAAARVAALESVLREMVDAPHAGGQRVSTGNREQWVCIYCGEHSPAVHPQHAPDCPVTRARRLLDGAG